MYYKKCSRCGYSYGDFVATGLLGCPDCYKSFEEELKPSIKKFHSAIIHTGKKPSCTGVDKKLIAEYKLLLKEKQQAVLDGRFSDMAELTLQIDALADELKNRGLM